MGGKGERCACLAVRQCISTLLFCVVFQRERNKVYVQCCAVSPRRRAMGFPALSLYAGIRKYPTTSDSPPEEASLSLFLEGKSFLLDFRKKKKKKREIDVYLYSSRPTTTRKKEKKSSFSRREGKGFRVLLMPIAEHDLYIPIRRPCSSVTSARAV